MKINLSKISQIFFFVVVLPLLSVLLVSSLNFILQPLNHLWFYSYLDTIGILGAYVFLYSQFNSYVWDWWMFRFFRIVEVPNLSGRWRGDFISSFNNTKMKSYLEIKQTFSKIEVFLYGIESSSKSLIADFVELDNGDFELHYEYHNEPYVNATKTMHGHDGVVKLRYFPKERLLKGSYYNSSQHDRGHGGLLSFKLGSKNLKGGF